MPKHHRIPGLSRGHKGWWSYRPPLKGLPKGSPRPKHINLHTKDLSEALRKIHALNLSRPGDVRPIGDLIEPYVEAKLASGSFAALTASGVRGTLEHFRDHFGNPMPGTISREDLRGYHRALKGAKLSADTAHRYIRYIRAFYSWLVECDLLPANPFLRMAFPTPRQSRREGFCTREQRDALIAAADPGCDLRTILLLGFLAGLRFNEILHARRSWITTTTRGGVLTVTHDAEWRTKNQRERQIPLAAPVLEHVAGILAKPGNAADFLVAPAVPHGKHLYRYNPRRSFRALTESVDLPWVTYHTMRHTFGSLHAIAGTPEIKIRRWMGITPRTFELHYAGLLPDDDEINNAL